MTLSHLSLNRNLSSKKNLVNNQIQTRKLEKE
jgi:hypothetical protein